ncbi:MAG: hypothetical protein ACXW1P_03700 [Methylophilaceae bacterium]
MKKIYIPFSTFILGVVLGFGFCWLQYGRHLQQSLSSSFPQMLGVFTSAVYTQEVTEADNQFNNPNNAVAIYALNRAVNSIERFPPSEKEFSCIKTSFMLGKYNIRLASLYDQNNQQDLKVKHLNKALSAYEAMGWKLNGVDELNKATPVDSPEDLKEAITKYGTRVPSCLDHSHNS